MSGWKWLQFALQFQWKQPILAVHKIFNVLTSNSQKTFLRIHGPGKVNISREPPMLLLLLLLYATDVTHCKAFHTRVAVLQIEGNSNSYILHYNTLPPRNARACLSVIQSIMFQFSLQISTCTTYLTLAMCICELCCSVWCSWWLIYLFFLQIWLTMSIKQRIKNDANWNWIQYPIPKMFVPRSANKQHLYVNCYVMLNAFSFFSVTLKLVFTCFVIFMHSSLLAIKLMHDRFPLILYFICNRLRNYFKLISAYIFTYVCLTFI